MRNVPLALVVVIAAGAPIGLALAKPTTAPTSKDGATSIEDQIAAAPRVDLAAMLAPSKFFDTVKDGKTFTCGPKVDSDLPLPLFMTGHYCQMLCPNDDPVYVANWQGTGQSVCHCPHKNKTWVY